MKHKGAFFRFILLAVDLILAVWIISSYRKATAGDPRETTPPVQTAKDRTTEMPGPSSAQAPATKTPAAQTPPASVPVTEKPSPARPEVPARAAEELARFSWYLDGVMTDGVPAGSGQITDLPSLFGSWKALLYVDPEGPAARMLFADVLLDAGQSGFAAVFDEYLNYDVRRGTAEERFSQDSPVYSFTQEEGLICVSADGQTIYLYFYEYGGRQYASGVFQSSAGYPVFAALAR